MQNNLMNNNNCKEWSYRYGRNGVLRSNIIKEDEDMLRDHVENMKKKKCKYYFFTEKMYLFSNNFNYLKILYITVIFLFLNEIY